MQCGNYQRESRQLSGAWLKTAEMPTSKQEHRLSDYSDLKHCQYEQPLSKPCDIALTEPKTFLKNHEQTLCVL